MRPRQPISSHEKEKKELLVLPRDQLLFLLTLGLNKYRGDNHEIHHYLMRAADHEPALGTWTAGKVERIHQALIPTPFVVGAFRGLQVAHAWRIPLVFAADAIRPEWLRALIRSIRAGQGFLPPGAHRRHYGIHFSDLQQRCIHHILLDEPAEFDKLYRQFQLQSAYATPNQLLAQRAVDAVLATVDWNFWKTRSRYFQLSAFSEHQYSYPSWKLATPAELEPMLVALHEDGSREVLPEATRIITFLGLHHFAANPERFAPFDPALEGLCHLVQGRDAAAAAAFARMPPHDPEETAGILEVIRCAYEYGRGNWDLNRLSEAIAALKISEFPKPINCFIAFGYQETGQTDLAEEILLEQFSRGFDHPYEWVVGLWCAAWTGIRVRQEFLEPLYAKLDEGAYRHLPWLEGEIAHVLRRQYPRRELSLPEGSPEAGPDPSRSLLRLLPVKPLWAYALRQLRQAGEAAQPTVPDAPDFRTIWIVDFAAREAYCKVQKRGAKGWSKGRRMKWTELLAPKDLSALDQADHAALAALSTRDGRRLSSTMYYSDDAVTADFGRLLYELAEHPRVLLGEKRRIPIELIRAEPELRVTELPGGEIGLRFEPDVEGEGYVWQKETPTRYRIYHLNERQARMAWAISGGITLPEDQRAAVEEIVEQVRPAVRVQSSFDLIGKDLETVTGSSVPCFHLLPQGEGYKVELYVKPLPEESFYFKPGDGMGRSIIELEAGRRILVRPLAEELAQAGTVIAACPTLARLPHPAFEWMVEDTQTALHILLELRARLAEGQATIEHPKGEKLRIVGQAGSDELALRVGKERDWFAVDGKLTVSEERVLDLERLLDQLRQRNHPFIELGEGEFVALTEELRDRILEMEGLLHRKGGKWQLPTLAAGAFAELTEDLDDLSVDAAWRESLDRIAKAGSIRPRVPKSFRAELRDYQKEGFRWLMRLAAWGVGGCLADDMGLGKTVQALAVLSARADQGPSLVIAPASVTRNWQRETERFAPDLVPVLIASSQDAAHLPQLGTGDLALVSYGLLPFIGDELAEIDFANIILDEAQAIKNAATKRAQVVRSLRGDFRLATTGTPIENHLGELWSLFRFLNPGLLGSKAAFNEKFNKPIARDGNEERRTALKKLVRPFILRRRKDEVLTELPPKTEIVLNVQLSEEEKALYEALRRQAVREIAAADEQQKHFTVLAQLTKLRQAACHPRLVRPRSKIGSAKLELVGETLREILENDHKALIFSQFVKHLKIVENWVKGQGIAYQYLDGSTPGKQREAAVQAFQAGEGRVFLISLKAGGTGLNLTAADYVLHLDPWWNPAAEDQASDRAHRIGQQRPVTVYRFVSEGTIEEQIIALHAEKRDLADQILAGTGRAGSLGVEEILTLIRTS